MLDRISAYQPPRDEAIRAFSCGLSAEQREHHRLVMLQAYIDDSGNDPSDPVFLLAGLVSTVPKWEAFSDRWRQVLGYEPVLPYFKASEARWRAKSFSSGWSPTLIDRRIYDLAEIAASYTEYRVASFVYRRDFDYFIGSIGADIPRSYGTVLRDPYTVCLLGITLAVAHLAQETEQPLPSDYIIDEHGKIGSEAIQLWEMMKDSIPSSAKKWMGNAPSFRDDKVVLPLQAADLYAWHVHSSLVKELHAENDAAIPIHGLFKPIRELSVHLDRKKLRSLRRVIRRGLREIKF